MTVIWPLALSDPGDIIKAAEALRISEYDFFRLSFRRWSGREPDEKVLEQAFVAYMFHQTVPPWVRHLAREVLALEAEGRMNPKAYGISLYRRYKPVPKNGKLYIGLMAAMTALYCVALLDIYYDPETSAPMPCYGGPGFKIISDMVHSVAGKEPTVCEPVKDR